MFHAISLHKKCAPLKTKSSYAENRFTVLLYGILWPWPTLCYTHVSNTHTNEKCHSIGTKSSFPEKCEQKSAHVVAGNLTCISSLPRCHRQRTKVAPWDGRHSDHTAALQCRGFQPKQHKQRRGQKGEETTRKTQPIGPLRNADLTVDYDTH